ncbi:hypothetical protein WJX81_002135 [Elliptochloris bilobata]|uniref:Succinate dehydrogenase assembly factor 4, mitochondrial n=1 Tax=Elliptochloris bilobata TaxID=381761 RepID=A0AAW1S526_9CHLO
MLRRVAAQLANRLQEAHTAQCCRASLVPAAHSSGLCSAHTRQSSSAASSGAEPDPFTAQMQRRTEEELRALLEKHTEDGEPGDEEEVEEEELVSSTGEVGGPKGAYTGAEPTRYGDWERGGRCTDF